MKNMKFGVKDVFKEDFGKNIARIDPEIIFENNLNAGDIICIYNDSTKKSTAAIAFPSDLKDKGTKIVRIDAILRRNLNASQNNNQNVDNKNLILRSLKEKRDNLRIIINKGDIKVVYHTLKENGYSIQKISSLIGSDIKGPLYRGDTMKFKNFRALKNLFKKYSNNDIPYSYKDS
ncbi:MAG: hypothetical protein CEE43_10465 [Promethearchaeota archaeon Loki_b32]|nr:MAG: hypothetical protein CEE43_10465 [Candidatus Lokiarchaeota archaeon Loki_b32]